MFFVRQHQAIAIYNRHFVLTYQTHNCFFMLKKEKIFSPLFSKRAGLILNTLFLTPLVLQNVLKCGNYQHNPSALGFATKFLT